MKKLMILLAMGCLMGTAATAQRDTAKLRMYTPQSQPTLQPQQNTNKSFDNNSMYYQNNRLDQNRYNATPQNSGTYQAPGYSNPSQGVTPNATTPGTINTNPMNNINRTR